MKKNTLLTFLISCFIIASYGQCDLEADAPLLSADRTIVGVGRRGPGCTSNGEITVRLRQHRRFWFDKTLATSTGSGVNFPLPATYHCSGTGSQIVFTEVLARGKKVKSKRVSISFCG